jgi:hypothetical protein
MKSNERMTLPGKTGKSARRIPITNQFAGIFRNLLFRLNKCKRPSCLLAQQQNGG